MAPTPCFSLNPQSNQEQVYADLAQPIVEQALEGFNGTVFAYGQTGSGKSWSMMGSDTDPGIIPRINMVLFKLLGDMQSENPDKELMITVAYLEIYNEVIKDLLNPSDRKLEVRQHPKLGIYVQGLAELVVDSAESVSQYIESGNRVRRVASTSMNARSSRSHSCFTLKIKQKDVEQLGDGKQRTTELSARINLVDLAGSERQSKTGAEGERLREGAAINKSLSTLGQVINGLAEGKKHIPYRDSKLTRLLQDSLGGNSLTVMVATLSPADNNYEESLSTLRYAANAKRIKNTTKRNEDVSQQVIRELREEITALRQALAEAEAAREAAGEGGAHEGPSHQQVLDMEEKLEALKEAQAQDWEKQRKLSELYEQERAKNLRDEQRIKSVMLTIKEEKVATLQRIAALEKARGKARKLYDKRRREMASFRSSIAEKLEQYQELLQDGGEDGVHKAELAGLIQGLEQDQASLQTSEAAAAQLKAEIKVLMREESEARQEAAAHTLLLEEDAELREKIAKEERQALAEEHARAMAEALEKQRAELTADTEKKKQALMQVDASGHQESPEMVQLQLELLQAKADQSMLSLELEEAKRRAKADLAQARAAHRAALREAKSKGLKMFRTVVQGASSEVEELRAKLELAARQLAAAGEDLQFMVALNDALRAQVEELGGVPVSDIGQGQAW